MLDVSLSARPCQGRPRGFKPGVLFLIGAVMAANLAYVISGRVRAGDGPRQRRRSGHPGRSPAGDRALRRMARHARVRPSLAARPGGGGRRLRALPDQRPLDLGRRGLGVRERLGLGLGDVSLWALGVGRAHNAVALEPGFGLEPGVGAVANRGRRRGLGSSGASHGDHRSARLRAALDCGRDPQLPAPRPGAISDPRLVPNVGGPCGAAGAPAAHGPTRAAAPGAAAEDDCGVAPGRAAPARIGKTPAGH